MNLETTGLMQAARAAQHALDVLADTRRAALSDHRFHEPERAAGLSGLATDRARATEALRTLHRIASQALAVAPQIQAHPDMAGWEPPGWPVLRATSTRRLAPWELSQLVEHGAEDAADDERWGAELVAWARDLLLAFDEVDVLVPEEAA
jgi:hypothetical protein